MTELIIILLGTLIFVSVMAIWFYRKSEFWQEMASLERIEKEYYSKESLDNMEEVFFCRRRIQELTEELAKTKK